MSHIFERLEQIDRAYEEDLRHMASPDESDADFDTPVRVLDYRAIKQGVIENPEYDPDENPWPDVGPDEDIS